MKRNEFKLLLEDWKKNFIVESDLPEISNDELESDLEGYFDDGSFEEPGLDDLGHPSHMHSSDYDSQELSLGSDDLENPTYSSDSEEHIDGFSGMYPDDPTYTPGDHSSIGDYNLDGENIDNLLPETDLMDNDDDAGF